MSGEGSGRRHFFSNGLNGSQLKLAAVVAMLVDHMAYLLLGRGYLPVLTAQIRELAGSGSQAVFYSALLASHHRWLLVYRLMRSIGRIAFPIYAFLLTEGYCHTRDWRRYAVRLGVFALLSEIPYNLVIAGSIFYPKEQNVFFTLLIGLLTVRALDIPGQGPEAASGSSLRPGMTSGLPDRLLRAAVLTAALFLAWYLHTDYDYQGIFLIVIFYYFRFCRKRGCLTGFLWMICMPGRWYYVPGYLAAFGLIWLYNGRRGWQPWKVVFYLFYPLHLLVLYGIYTVFPTL